MYLSNPENVTVKTLIAATLLALCATPVLAADPTEIRDPYQGNISCRFSENAEGAQVRCDLIEHRAQQADNKPADCTAGYGNAFLLRATGPGEVLCTDEAKYDASIATVDFDRSVTHGGITCTAQFSGFFCKNETGGSFRLSMRQQRVD